MKFVALVSGGKDSIYSIVECIRNGHELVGCVHLGPPTQNDEESFMYQSAASEVLPTLVEDCIGVPLVLHRRAGTSANTSLVYHPNLSEKDEVEDMFQALRDAKHRFPDIQAVSSGAILSTYQRVRIEDVCARLGLTSLSYLWRIAPQHDLLKRMLDDGISAVLVKTACPPGLVPRKHLNKTLGDLYNSGLFEKLHDKYQFHMCGEGGEYESLVLDCPLYKKRLVLDEVEIVEENDDGVGELVIMRFHAETKEQMGVTADCVADSMALSEEASPTETENASSTSSPLVGYMPRVRQVSGGLLHVSELMSPSPGSAQDEHASESDLAVREALATFRLLQKTLAEHGATAQDVILVHLYLSEISHFGGINAHYRRFFGTLLPPSRSCVAVGKGVLPGGRRVLLDCIVQLGSGSYMRSTNGENPYAAAAALTKTSCLRQVLHVQSISYWAPVCVGPYSQVNTLRSGVHFLAGQIGLVPETMTLRKTWSDQLDQCWTNVARVLDALDGGSLDDMLSCLVYVSSRIVSRRDDWKKMAELSRRQILANGGVSTGVVDASPASPSTAFDGYEDEETWRELSEPKLNTESSPPAMLFVSIPEMPMGALAEVEVVCASRRAADGLALTSMGPAAYEHTTSDIDNSVVRWESGHAFEVGTASIATPFSILTSMRSLGHGCIAMATVSASTAEPATEKSGDLNVDTEVLLYDMLASLNDSKSSIGLTVDDILHVRLYYRWAGTSLGETGDSTSTTNDGIQIRTALSSVLALFCSMSMGRRCAPIPAYSVVPVHNLHVIHSRHNATTSETTTVVAMQVLFINPVHLETEMWVHCDRSKGELIL